MATQLNTPGLSQDDKTLQLQLDFLKLEFEANNAVIGRLDEATRATKNWAIAVWTGAVALFLSKPELSKYLVLTAVLPVMFWFVDAQQRRIQRSFIFRIMQMSAFLNDERLSESVKQNRIKGLRVLDPRAKNARDTKEYQSFTSVGKTARFKEVAPFYLSLSVLSVVAAVVVALTV